MQTSEIPRIGGERRLGHSDVATTMIYTHVLKVGGGGRAQLEGVGGRPIERLKTGRQLASKPSRDNVRSWPLDSDHQN